MSMHTRASSAGSGSCLVSNVHFRSFCLVARDAATFTPPSPTSSRRDTPATWNPAESPGRHRSGGKTMLPAPMVRCPAIVAPRTHHHAVLEHRRTRQPRQCRRSGNCGQRGSCGRPGPDCRSWCPRRSRCRRAHPRSTAAVGADLDAVLQDHAAELRNLAVGPAVIEPAEALRADARPGVQHDVVADMGAFDAAHWSRWCNSGRW